MGQPRTVRATSRLLSPGLLVHIQLAALQAWHGLPSQGSAISSISKIRQGAQEPFSDFGRRLNEAAEQFIGPAETDSELIRHLAFQNANAADRPYCALMAVTRPSQIMSGFVQM